MKQILLTSLILFGINVIYSQNIWTQKANFGGSARWGAVSFSIGNKGYIGTGSTGGGSGPLTNDFWEYDPNTNTWSQKADFGGSARGNGIGLSIGNKGYIGTGYIGTGSSETSDFWEYDPVAN